MMKFRSLMKFRSKSPAFLRLPITTRSPPLTGFSPLLRSKIPLSYSIRMNFIRSFANDSGDAVSDFSTRTPKEMVPLYPGCDYEHWLIVMKNPGGDGATKEQMLHSYVQTLANVLGSEEEAKRKMYSVSFDKYTGFGCEIDEETSNKLEESSDVLFVIPDAYVDVENKDYGGELFVNGEIVQRSPEREKRVHPIANRDKR